ncbi:hypothetical protein F511_45918 [Dorcoceras hygrometricum]|uniref:Uncharacterized protein n=1 Tax=Dorcoceras hygrometricum TaxID=472368 RepID=A0A2Z6ZUW1_9LAMI|nr:hypothetical protein F511_45918 [Dorcoceras hygrometricum]
MHARARAKPRDGAAHPLRTSAESWPLLHVRLSHVAGQGLVRLARSCALLDAEELRDGRASGRRSMRDDGSCTSQGGARDIAQRCDVEAPLRARWPDDAAEDGRRLNARWSRDHRVLAERYRATLAVEARCRRDLRGGGAAGRPPLRRCSGDVVTAGLISSRFGSGLSRTAREVFGPVCDPGPGFDRF